MKKDMSEAVPDWELTESAATTFNPCWDSYIEAGDSSPDPMPTDVPRQWHYRLYFRPVVVGVADGDLVDFKFGMFLWYNTMGDGSTYIYNNFADFSTTAKNLAIMVG
jgi:hypothetical protein